MPRHAPQRRALLSVSDKEGLTAFARTLLRLGFELLATSGTRQILEGEKIPVTAVETLTDFPTCFGGRVKTLHPKILGAILFRRGLETDEEEAKALGIAPIDLVAVTLYPFQESARDPKKTQEEIIEQVDVGGVTLLRAAAKNYAHVTAICDPSDYERVLAEISTHGDTSPELRAELAAKVYFSTATYDAAITEYLSRRTHHGVMLTRGMKLRYGENPHQWGKHYQLSAIGYQLSADRGQGWGMKLQGKEMSYLNILDADAAWAAVQEFEEPTAVFVKHANPSGIASHEDITEAFQRAYDADRLSAFGVIIALNRPCTEGIAQKLIEQKIFTEVIVAPAYEDGARALLKEKLNLRVLIQTNSRSHLQWNYRSVLDGMLVQEQDTRTVSESDLTCVTKVQPTREQIRDLLFAWKCVKHAKSNAVVFAKDRVTIGIGAGQTSRVDATWIAARRAGEKSKGAVMASDAFLPFPDSVEEAAKHGIAAIIQPGGSIRDTEVFAKADALGIAMVTTGVRAFHH